MANDREVLREVWEGRLPIKFSLAEEDKGDMLGDKEDYYILAPRMTYLPLLPVRKHFDTAIPADTEVWFSYKGTPLKWHYPIGVLYDLVAYGTLPWHITLKINDFPEDTLQKLGANAEEMVKSNFIHMVKEAGYLKHRGTVMNNLRPDQHSQLWRGLSRDKFDDFWMINHRLMEHMNNEPFRSIPYRVYTGLDQPYIQKFFKPMTEDGQLTSLGQLIKHCLPDIVEENLDPEDPDIIKSYKVTQDKQVLIQGIESPLDTPVQWLSEHISHADNFLHIVVRDRQPASTL